MSKVDKQLQEAFALPKEATEYLRAILPNGWVLLYSYPAEEKGVENLNLCSTTKPDSGLNGFVNNLRRNLNEF